MSRKGLVIAFGLLALSAHMSGSVESTPTPIPLTPPVDVRPSDSFDPTVIQESTYQRQTIPIQQVASWVDPVTGIEVNQPTIIQISTAGCPPCMAFMAGGKDAYERVGWVIIETKQEVEGVTSFPAYRVLNKGKWYWVRGVMTPSKLRQALQDKSEVVLELQSSSNDFYFQEEIETTVHPAPLNNSWVGYSFTPTSEPSYNQSNCQIARGQFGPVQNRFVKLFSNNRVIRKSSL